MTTDRSGRECHDLAERAAAMVAEIATLRAETAAR